jgi:hypothetical protein
MQSGETLMTATIVIEPEAIQSIASAVSSARPSAAVRANISLIRRDRTQKQHLVDLTRAGVCHEEHPGLTLGILSVRAEPRRKLAQHTKRLR